MAYSRFGSGSDIYLMGSESDGEQVFYCCGCLLVKRHWRDEPNSLFGGYLEPDKEGGTDFTNPSRQKTLDHLRDHLAAGHDVPDHAFTGIFEETEWGQP